MGYIMPVKGRCTWQCDVGKGKGTHHLQEIMFGLEKEANWKKMKKTHTTRGKSICIHIKQKRFNKNISTDKDIYYTMIKRLRRKIRQ